MKHTIKHRTKPGQKKQQHKSRFPQEQEFSQPQFPQEETSMGSGRRSSRQEEGPEYLETE